jgi:hypothetical protein
VAYDVEADDWGEVFYATQQATGWTYAQIGELTFTQLVSWNHKGKDPKPRVADPGQIRALALKYAEMNNRGQISRGIC